MKRTTVFLAEAQMKALQAEAKRTGLTVAELIRRAVDAYLPTRKG